MRRELGKKEGEQVEEDEGVEEEEEERGMATTIRYSLWDSTIYVGYCGSSDSDNTR